MEVQLTRMTPRDVSEVAEIEKLCFSQPWSENGFRSTLEQECACYLVARRARQERVEDAKRRKTGEPFGDSDKIVGYCGLLQSFEEADILNVAVHPQERGQGVAFAMLQRLMEIGRERGVERFTLEVRKSNTAAIRLYEKLGFASAGIRPNFYEKPVEDAVIMWTDFS